MPPFEERRACCFAADLLSVYPSVCQSDGPPIVAVDFLCRDCTY